MLFPLQYDVGVDNNDFRPISFAEVKARIEAQVEAARKEAGLNAVSGANGEKRIVFLDPAIAPTTVEQRASFERLKAYASDITEVSAEDGQSLKEAIGQRVALFPGNVRFVYVGTQVYDDFSHVVVDKGTGLTEGNVDTAIQILK